MGVADDVCDAVEAESQYMGVMESGSQEEESVALKNNLQKQHVQDTLGVECGIGNMSAVPFGEKSSTATLNNKLANVHRRSSPLPFRRHVKSMHARFRGLLKSRNSKQQPPQTTSTSAKSKQPCLGARTEITTCQNMYASVPMLTRTQHSHLQIQEQTTCVSAVEAAPSSPITAQPSGPLEPRTSSPGETDRKKLPGYEVISNDLDLTQIPTNNLDLTHVSVSHDLDLTQVSLNNDLGLTPSSEDKIDKVMQQVCRKLIIETPEKEAARKRYIHFETSVISDVDCDSLSWGHAKCNLQMSFESVHDDQSLQSDALSIDLTMVSDDFLCEDTYVTSETLNDAVSIPIMESEIDQLLYGNVGVGLQMSRATSHGPGYPQAYGCTNQNKSSLGVQPGGSNVPGCSTKNHLVDKSATRGQHAPLSTEKEPGSMISLPGSVSKASLSSEPLRGKEVEHCYMPMAVRTGSKAQPQPTGRKMSALPLTVKCTKRNKAKGKHKQDTCYTEKNTSKKLEEHSCKISEIQTANKVCVHCSVGSDRLCGCGSSGLTFQQDSSRSCQRKLKSQKNGAKTLDTSIKYYTCMSNYQTLRSAANSETDVTFDDGIVLPESSVLWCQQVEGSGGSMSSGDSGHASCSTNDSCNSSQYDVSLWSGREEDFFVDYIEEEPVYETIPDEIFSDNELLENTYASIHVHSNPNTPGNGCDSSGLSDIPPPLPKRTYLCKQKGTCSDSDISAMRKKVPCHRRHTKPTRPEDILKPTDIVDMNAKHKYTVADVLDSCERFAGHLPKPVVVPVVKGRRAERLEAEARQRQAESLAESAAVTQRSKKGKKNCTKPTECVLTPTPTDDCVFVKSELSQVKVAQVNRTNSRPSSVCSESALSDTMLHRDLALAISQSASRIVPSTPEAPPPAQSIVPLPSPTPQNVAAAISWDESFYELQGTFC